MTRFPRVALTDTAPSPADLARRLAARGMAVDVRPGAPADPGPPNDMGELDALVLSPADEVPAGLLEAVADGLGVLLLGSGDQLARLGIRSGAGVPAAPVRPGDVSGLTEEDLLARVDTASLAPTGSFDLDPAARPLLVADGEPVGAVAVHGAGRVAALAVDPGGADELVAGCLSFVARRGRAPERAVDSHTAAHPAWLALKEAVVELQGLQVKDGSVPEVGDHARARELVGTLVDRVEELAPLFPHDADYLSALTKDLDRWAEDGFGVPDFLDSIVAFAPASYRRDGLEHLVVFPMYTQNGSPNRYVEAVLLQVVWPDFVDELERGAYSNKLFLPIRFLDFTPGYDTNSAVLFPETVAMREVPKFTWGGIFADREAARFRRVVGEAAGITGLSLPSEAARLLADQQLAEQTFVMWDLIHDRTHMHGDLPFDPFMIKQRMPYFLYSLEELRCDLTAFREAVALEAEGVGHARLVQYAVLFDRIFRFAITGNRVRNYDGLGGQLLFAWLHQKRVLHWTDNRLSIDWADVTEPVLELGRRIEDLYWRSIDRPKTAHWLAAYRLVSETLEPHPASVWAKGADALPVDGPPKGLTDAVLDDEFPLSMFYEALSRKMAGVIESTKGITG